MSLEERFNEVVEAVHSGGVDRVPTQQEKLKLYAWFKQAKDGDVEGEAPGMANFVARAKFLSWEKVKGMSADEAMKHYIHFFYPDEAL